MPNLEVISIKTGCGKNEYRVTVIPGLGRWKSCTPNPGGAKVGGRGCTRPTSRLHSEPRQGLPTASPGSRPADHTKYSGKLLRCDPSASVLFM